MIDSSLFGADIPAGTYTKGDVIQLKNIAGPATVRSGRGAAYLKNINSGIVTSISGNTSNWKIKIKNSDWIDPTENISGQMGAVTALDMRSGSNNFGHDCPLTPNSEWVVEAECLLTVTTTEANSIYTIIDVDYPEVAGIIDPVKLRGFPTAIEFNRPAEVINPTGTIESSGWSVSNVDIFKAGFKYALEKVEHFADVGCMGFLSIGNAAGMAGLSRIIPIVNNAESIKQTINYASVLVKGPMDIKTMLFKNATGAAVTADSTIIFDYVKVKV